MMRRLHLALVAVAVSLVSAGAYAVDDPIVSRKALMDANGGAAGAGAAMLKEQVPFNVPTAKSVLLTMHAVAYTYGNFFPPGSDKGETKASPKIWEDPAGFAAALLKFQQDTDAALKSDPQDLDSFKAAFGQVAGNCKSCHDAYKLSN